MANHVVDAVGQRDPASLCEAAAADKKLAGAAKASFITKCVKDAKAAIAWVRENARRLGIDPDKIAAGGGSAGGHLAASVATLPGLDDAKDDKSVSCLPNALVLFNPGTVMAPFPGLDLKGFGAGLDKDKFGCEPTEISPIHHVKKGTPPTVIATACGSTEACSGG